MTKREFAALAARILGIYLFVRWVTPALLMPIVQGMQINTIVDRGGDSASLLPIIGIFSLSVIGTVLPILTGLLLCFKADKFAAYVFPEDSSPATLAVSSNTLPMAFALTGVIILALILPHMLGIFIAQNMASDAHVSSFERAQNILDLSASFVQVIFGIWLIFGAGKLSTTIKRVLNLTRDR